MSKFMLLMFMFLLIISYSIYEGDSNYKLKISCLNIGQGDSIFIQTSEKSLLIDGGPDNQLIKKIGGYMNYWNHSIDYVLLTHPDSDHVTGLIQVLKNYHISGIFLTEFVGKNKHYTELFRIIKEKGIPIIYVKAQEKIFLSDDVFIELIFPDNLIENFVFSSPNNYSILTRVVYNDFKFLFTGDAEKELESYIVEKGYDIQAQFLKVAHHGSKTSTTKKFLDVVDPNYAIIQVGNENRFGHPSFRVLHLLKTEQVEIFRNDFHGDIVFKFSYNE